MTESAAAGPRARADRLRDPSARDAAGDGARDAARTPARLVGRRDTAYTGGTFREQPATERKSTPKP